VLMVRLKQCECALSNDLLDEAFELARQPDLRAHRRGQELAGELVDALVHRGQSHLGAGRLLQASSDCEKAMLLGGNQPEVAQLRTAVNNAMQNRDRANREFGQALAAARRHADQGQLTLGEQVLAAIESRDARVDGLKQELAGRRAAMESVAKKASDALAAGDWQASIDFVSTLRRGCSQDVALRQLCGKICDHVAQKISGAFESGRLDVASSMLIGLDRLPVQNVEAQHLRSTLDQCRAAYNAIENGRPQEAEATLRRLHAAWPKASWITETADRCKQLGDALSAVRGSPLSLAAMVSYRNDAFTQNAVASPFPRNAGSAGASSAESFCLHVDGVGSFQVFTAPALTIGPVSASRGVDIPLMLDAGVPTVTLSRSDEDYFLKAARPVLVNESSIVSKMLSSGDRIGLGSRCRITFRRPSAASASAVLDLSGTRLPASTIRQLVLMDREIIIGPGATAHIRADELAAPVVFQMRGKGLFCRSAAEIMVDDKAVGTSAEIPVGARISVGPVRFVVAGAGNGLAKELRS
jgi:tetratricopeptide (TPR) repeat protein